MNKPVVLTGLRTNAEYHLGNYIGAIIPMVQMAQEKAGEFQINMFAPDLHSFTTQIDHTLLRQQTMHNLRLFLACGIPADNPDVYLYRQSYISAHSELAIILNNFAYFGELSRMTEFKDKMAQIHEKYTAEFVHDARQPDETQKQREDFFDNNTVTAGLFDYPVLMAADILLYNAEWVPVGDDQRQHLEFTRDIAMRMNNKFDSPLFTVPRILKEQQAFVNRDAAPRIRSLRNPLKKMSKSVSDPAGTIKLSDTPAEAAKKIMGATTDSIGAVHLDWEKQPGISNLLQILALLSRRSLQEVASEWEGNERYGDLKKAVAETVAAELDKIQSNLAAVDESALAAKLEHDEAQMRELAGQTLARVQRAVGLRPKS